MPRKNRQKLHRSLRLAAEARKAEAARRRREDRALVARSAARARQALRRPVTAQVAGSGEPITPLMATIRTFLELAHVDPGQRRRVEALVRVVHREAPALARLDLLPWYLLLCRHPWLRSADAWTAPSGSERRKRDHLAAWLLARWPVPPFLLRALDVEPMVVARVPVEDEWAVGLLAWIGQGKSLRSLVGSDHLPAPLTRRMCSLFLGAKADSTPVAALRRAQVVALGGPPPLVQTLLRTRLGRLHGPDPRLGEPFWQGVIGWLCRREALAKLDAAALDQVLAWVEACRHDPEWSLKGRTPATVLRDVAAWQARQGPGEHEAFPSSGLAPLADLDWVVEELRTPAAVRAEADAMQHCAAHYLGLLRRGRVALWSLRRNALRVATVEVALAAGRVVQAKRKCNVAIDAMERRVLERWAQVNGLRVDPAL